MPAFTIERFESLLSRLEEFESQRGFLARADTHRQQVRIDTEGLLSHDPTNPGALEARTHAEQQVEAYQRAYREHCGIFFQELIGGRSAITLEAVRENGNAKHYRLDCWAPQTRINPEQALQVLSALYLCEVRSGELVAPIDLAPVLHNQIRDAVLVLAPSEPSDPRSPRQNTFYLKCDGDALVVYTTYGTEDGRFVKTSDRRQLDPQIETSLLARLSEAFTPRVRQLTVKYESPPLLPPIGDWMPSVSVDVEPNG